MNFVPCVAWVSRGKAASVPHKLQLSPDELKRLVEEATEQQKQKFAEENDEESKDLNSFDENAEEDEKQDDCDDKGGNDEDDDFDAKYNMDSYDNDDEQNPIFSINSSAVYVDNHEDEYLTDRESEDDFEEKEDFNIKDSDNLLIAGHVEDTSSVLEIYVYNQEEGSCYVHHDIVLPSYPLSLAWLDFHPADEKPGNYVAIGDMSPVISIYDLDVADVLEPEFTLGVKKKKTGIKGKKTKCHSDSVLSLSWNKNVRNILASGSADSSVIVWDLTERTILNKYSFHSNKVQALEWHPTESQFLLSGCTDGLLKLYDCQSDEESKSWKVDGEIEKVVWNIGDSFKFFCSTDQGCIYTFDIRNEGIEKSFQAHNEAITGLDISPLRPDILISASMDKTLKVWDLNEDYKMIKSLKLKVGSIYAAKVAPDLDLTVAVGGDDRSHSLKVLDILKENKDTQSSNQFEDVEPKIENNEPTTMKRNQNFGTHMYYKSQEGESLNTNKKKKKRKTVGQEGNGESRFHASTSVAVSNKYKQTGFKRNK